MKHVFRILLALCALTCAASAQSWSDITALSASTIVKTSAGGLHRIVVYNSSASEQYILVFDSETLPADGALTRLLMPPIRVPANSTLDWKLDPVPFTRGLTLCNSSTDDTKTIGSADCRFKVLFK